MDFELNGKEYRAGVIDARKQFHIVRRLAPIFGNMAAGGDTAVMFANAIGSLSDDDADYVLFGLLAVVKRKEDNGLGWSPVSNKTQMMYAEITMAEMLQLAFKSFEANMQDFFSVSRSVLSQANPTQNAE